VLLAADQLHQLRIGLTIEQLHTPARWVVVELKLPERRDRRCGFADMIARRVIVGVSAVHGQIETPLAIAGQSSLHATPKPPMQKTPPKVTLTTD
jgi:hypothetical protein